jgi:hypothetical protein
LCRASSLPEADHKVEGAMSEYLVAFWNVENLFGPEDHPHRIPWVADD